MSKGLIAILVTALVLIAGVIGFALGNSGGDDPDPPNATTGATGVSPTGPTGTTPQAAGDRLNGLNLTAYTAEGYSRPAVKKQLQLIKDLGSTVVTVIPTWYMANANADVIAPNKRKSPTDASLEQVISWAKETGLKVMVKPHVDVIDETFRGDIQPSDRTKWFGSYGDFIGHYAELASSSGAELFSVGTELKSLSGDTDPWRQVISAVRGKFGGELTYAANWDEVGQVQFWDELDMIGVDAYYPLSSEGQEPTEADLVSAWQSNVSSLEATSLQWDRPVLFTEIGYPTQAGAAAHPFEVKRGEGADQRAQAIAYRAAFAAFADVPWMRGMIWWSWRADPSKSEKLEIDYTPEGKEAEAVLREFQAQ